MEMWIIYEINSKICCKNQISHNSTNMKFHQTNGRIENFEKNSDFWTSEHFFCYQKSNIHRN